MNKEDGKMLDVFHEKDIEDSLEDHVTNEEVLSRAGVHQLSSEVKRQRWKMIGHVLREERGNDCSIVLTWTPAGRRKQGRPKTTWRRTVEKERRGGVEELDEVRSEAVDREKWKCTMKALCATWHEEDR